MFLIIVVNQKIDVMNVGEFFMAMLSWNEIKSRAIRISREWKDEERESGEAKTFWNDFFNIFGISSLQYL